MSEDDNSSNLQLTMTVEKLQKWTVNDLKDFCRKKGLKVSGVKAELVARVFCAIEECKPNIIKSGDNSNQANDSLSLDQIKLWKVEALKDFCRKKGLKVSGNKDVLIARVFCALEFDLPDVLTAEEQLKLKQKEYNALLETEKFGRLPDPFSLKNGWIHEQDGRKKWPTTMYGDICIYMHGKVDTGEAQQAMNDYKEGKAYSYFDSKWLKEIFYHPISENSKICYLKAVCCPSQRISAEPHEVWVMIMKDTGEILSAYCKCFAGLGSTCNHVVAVLFKMDYYWRQGLTNLACTDKPCYWNKYGAEKTVLEPSMIKDLDFRKPKFRKKNDKRASTSKEKKEYKPQNSDPFSFEELFNELSNVCPNAVVFKGVKELSPQDLEHEEIRANCRIPLHDELKNCKTKDDINSVLASYSEEDVLNIEFETVGQGLNKNWLNHKKSRVTASFVYGIYTKTNSMLAGTAKRKLDCSNSVDLVMGNKIVSNNLPALKYGREMEPEALAAYSDLIKKTHLNSVVTENGLFVLKEKPQFGASPDALVTCDCCGDGLLEIKSPISISHDAPTSDNLKYIVRVNDKESLKKNHQYYAQVQWQMGVCSKPWCDFFVYSRHGHYLERIMFAEHYWNALLKNADIFYNDHVIPVILEGL